MKVSAARAWNLALESIELDVSKYFSPGLEVERVSARLPRESFAQQAILPPRAVYTGAATAAAAKAVVRQNKFADSITWPADDVWYGVGGGGQQKSRREKRREVAVSYQ